MSKVIIKTVKVTTVQVVVATVQDGSKPAYYDKDAIGGYVAAISTKTEVVEAYRDATDIERAMFYERNEALRQA